MDKKEMLINIKKLLGRNLYNSSFEGFSPLYLFTTENIKAYAKLFNLEGKDILVPTASFDHALECALMGAKHVDTFDVNLFARYYADFKLRAIQALECDAFLKFFCTRDGNKINNECFDEVVYKKKIRPLLNKESRLFFDLVYKEVGYGYNVRNSRLFYNNQNNTVEQKKICFYLNDFDKIKKLSTKLNSSIHYQANVVDLPNIVNLKYDYIMLSNIQHYVDQIFPYDDLALQKYREFIKKDLMNLVKANGLIVGEYYYSGNTIKNATNCIAVNVKAMYNGQHDTVLLYKK